MSTPVVSPRPARPGLPPVLMVGVTAGVWAAASLAGAGILRALGAENLAGYVLLVSSPVLAFCVAGLAAISHRQGRHTPAAPSLAARFAGVEPIEVAVDVGLAWFASVAIPVGLTWTAATKGVALKFLVIGVIAMVVALAVALSVTTAWVARRQQPVTPDTAG